MTTTIISKITDGLGNQMFQYATGVALALRLGADFYIDNRWFEIKRGKNKITRDFALQAFPNIQLKTAAPNLCKSLGYLPDPTGFEKLWWRMTGKQTKKHPKTYIIEPHFQYWDGLKDISHSAYLQGFWQNEQYFSQHRDKIIQLFTFPHFDNPDALKIQML